MRMFVSFPPTDRKAAPEPHKSGLTATAQGLVASMISEVVEGAGDA
ncbi:hypothetical protein ACH347_02625 [Saccharopolyspora sp. 5N102]